MMRRLRRWYLIGRARLGLTPPRRPDPCEVCGTRSKRNVTVTSDSTVNDPEAAGWGPVGFSMTATYCRTHQPLTKEAVA